MSRYGVNQHLIVLNLYSVSINKILVTELESFAESKFDIKYVDAVKAITQYGRLFKSNQMFGTKHSKTNRLQKTIECKTKNVLDDDRITANSEVSTPVKVAKTMNRVHYIRIEICRYKFNQIRLALVAFASTCLC